jgi:hypothetical protein
MARHGAVVVECRFRTRLTASCNAVLYSVARFVNADRFLVLSPDTLVLDDLRPVFGAVDACPRMSILACRDSDLGQGNLLRELCTRFAGKRDDLNLLLGKAFDEGSYPLAVNDGVFAGGRGALLALDNFIRTLPNAVAWVDALPDHEWRSQFVFNLALARMARGVELDTAYNLQVHAHDVQIGPTPSGVIASWRGMPVRILHFCRRGRDSHPEIRGLYASGLCAEEPPRERDVEPLAAVALRGTP